MKRILIWLLILSASAFAQAPPLKLTLTSGHLTARNTSGQEVIAFVVKWSSTKQTNVPLSHDWYFKPHGIAPAEIREVNGDLPDDIGDITKATLLFVQSVDGSTWGDIGAAKAIMDQREPMKQFYQALATAAGQGEAAFLNRLNSEASKAATATDEGGAQIEGILRGHAKHLLQVQQQSGTQAAMDMVNERLAAANSRTF